MFNLHSKQNPFIVQNEVSEGHKIKLSLTDVRVLALNALFMARSQACLSVTQYDLIFCDVTDKVVNLPCIFYNTNEIHFFHGDKVNFEDVLFAAI